MSWVTSTTRRALTLIELLAVIMILTLIAGMLSTRLGAVDDGAMLRRAATDFHLLDQRARIAARSSGYAMVISVNRQGTVVTLGTFRDEHHEYGEHDQPTDHRDELSRIDLPPDITCHITTDELPAEIIFDRTGRSIDYTVELRTGQQVHARWHVSGLTGGLEVLP